MGSLIHSLDSGSKAKAWLFFTKMLFCPNRKNQGFFAAEKRAEKEVVEMIECQSLHTAAARAIDLIGRWENMSSVRSVPR